MLSARAQKYAQIGYQHGALDDYDPETNPSGVVDLCNSENRLVHEDLARFANAHRFDKSCFAYGEGDTGTLRLRKAMARHMNEYFHPAEPITPEHLTFTAGVTEINEACAFLTCDSAKDALLIGRPNYGSFNRDMRTRTEHVFASFEDTDQFSPDCIPFYSKVFDKAAADGLQARALVICNPNNPLGQCYSREALVAILDFCQSKKIHLISDEIYALSSNQPSKSRAETFVSVLSIPLVEHIDPNLVHVLYGMSKDYGAPGLRLGCLLTSNEAFASATRAICRFSSPSQISMSLAAAMLEDRTFIKNLLEKAQTELSESRRLAEKLLDSAGIKYHSKGNYGLFLWLDVRPFLPLAEAGGDGWEAEKLLLQKLRENGVLLILGQRYHSTQPGHLRLVYSVEEAKIREGVKRIQQVCEKIRK